MLPRPLSARPGVLPRYVGAALVACLALAHCGSGAGDDGPARASAEAILGGSVVDAPASPVLLLAGPGGDCSSVLVAPTLVLTARHCVAQTTPGGFSCTASGDVMNTGNGAGQIGTDYQGSALSFFTSATTNASGMISANPDAVGTQVISTQSPTACRDDLAFVVLDRTIPGLIPAPIRLTRQTAVGEAVSASGYGFTDHIEPTALRIVDGAQVEGVGPDLAPASTQIAPVRAVRIGAITCLGDSGGPIVSAATGAVIAIVSLGAQPAMNTPYCSPNTLVETTGPRLAAYHDWIAGVFQAVGASPITDDPMEDAATESAAPVEASSPPDGAAALEDAPATDELLAADDATAPDTASTVDAAIDAQPPQKPTGASCSTVVGTHRRSKRLGVITIALAWTAAAVGRRRR